MSGEPYLFHALFISDIHLGHDAVSADEIIAQLNLAIPDSVETGKLDMIVLAGDVFDQLVTLENRQSAAIKHWIYRLLKLARLRDIVVRVLLGTRSHDRNQGALFEEINARFNIGADCRYIDTCCIEHIDRFDLDFLYVPDEWRHDPEDTWRDVCQALHDANLEKVDYGIMHGFFDFQVPEHLGLKTHKSERYLNIVRKYITNGHDHTMKTLERILVNGSFSRLNHNEEEAKGHFRIWSRDRNGTSQDTVQFIENTEATIFKTLNICGLDEATAKSTLLEGIRGLRKGSRIRVKLEKQGTHMGLFQAMRADYPDYQWKAAHEKEKERRPTTPLFNQTPKHAALDFRPDTAPKILESSLQARGLNPDQIADALALFKQVQ